MNKSPGLSRICLMMLAVIVMVPISSCKQFGQPTTPSAEEALPAPGNFDPGMELTSQYLVCPTVPETNPLIPPGPYDEELGDCALRGRSAEIEAWLTALEQIAESCQANREPNWADTLATRDRLDSGIEEMIVIGLAPVQIEQVEQEETSSAYIEAPPPIESIDSVESSCPPYPSSPQIDSEYGERPESSYYFTAWLLRIGEEVGTYCKMIDELIEPLWLACDKVNFYQDCQEPNLDQYHALIETGMNAANTNYESTALFYTHSLQENGWDGFRAQFSETSIVCPLVPYAPDTQFTFAENAFCRSGPSLQYQKVATFLAHQEVQIVGRNQGELRWWLVSIPETDAECWVSDATGSADGELEELEIVVPPPPISADQCSSGLSESACLAAGGTWAGKDTPTPYCDCN